MLRHKIEPELGSRIIDLQDQSSDMNLLARNENEFQNLPDRIAEPRETIEQELEEHRLQLRQQELALQAERHAWQCELAEKQLLLQGRNAELDQNRSEIALLRKRVRELELVCQQTLTVSPSDAQPRLERKIVAFDATRNAEVHAERSILENGAEESVIALRRPLEKGSQENWDHRDDDFVLGEPQLADVREVSFTRPEEEADSSRGETEEKSSKIFGSRRWRIRGQKRRWRTKGEKQPDTE